MIRRLYIKLMHRLNRHVIAEDCWCKPTITSYRS